MKQLAKGILVGSLATVAAIASGVLTFIKLSLNQRKKKKKSLIKTVELLSVRAAQHTNFNFI